MMEQQEQALILVVDDSPDNLTMFHGLLKDTYQVKIATNGELALQIARAKIKPDLILLDVVMPTMNGYEVCQALKADPQTAMIPIIFLTALNDVLDEAYGLKAGAVDYITKPVSPTILMARVGNHLELKRAHDLLRYQNLYLESEVEKRTRDIVSVQDGIVIAMASLAETRDSDTGNHILRTQHYVRLLAEHLQKNPKFSHYLTNEQINLLFKSAPLHDIGKVGIPDSILQKPGRFTPEEFAIMKRHCQLGYDALSKAENMIDISIRYLDVAKEIAIYHHEKWDGSGYPCGLSRELIPISARLMALADVYDALNSRRVYKEAMSHEQAVDVIIEGRATHFDPDVVDAFIEIQDQFNLIAQFFCDSDEDLKRKREVLAVVADN